MGGTEKMTVTAAHMLSIAELGRRIRDRSIAPRALTEQMLARISVEDSRLHSFVTVTTDKAMRQAEQLERELTEGRWRGPLHGVPIALKDLFFTRDAPTECGTKVLRGWIPDFDATVVTRLEESGAILLGKLAMGEGAFVPHPELPAALNPWHSDYWPGMSSSGSGVACAAGLCFGTLGTDTGGSIRYPSSACGLSGMKPTYGRVSRHGVFPLAETLDHAGPMARSVQDAAILFRTIAGGDPLDPTSLDVPVQDDLSNLDASDASVRVGIDRALIQNVADSQVVAVIDEALAALRDLGVQVMEVSMPDPRTALDAFGIILAAEAADAHRSLFAEHADDYGPVLRGTVQRGLAVSGPDYVQAMRIRREFKQRYLALFSRIDALLVPVAPDPTPTLDVFNTRLRDPQMAQRSAFFAAPFNLTGLPSLTLPAGFTANGLPLGIQLAGPPLSETRLFRLGHRFQRHPIGARVPDTLTARFA